MHLRMESRQLQRRGWRGMLRVKRGIQMNLDHWLTRRAALSPTRPALFLGREMVADYAGFNTQVGAVAGWLVAQGVVPGDRIALFMKNVPEYLITLYAIWRCGAAAVPINAKLHGREAAYILDDAGAKLVFCSAELTQALQDADVATRLVAIPGAGFESARAAAPLARTIEREGDDLAWLFYTSGTTGKPKGVIITHAMMISMALCYETDVDVVQPEDAALYAAPMSHGAGLYNLMHVAKGARHICPASGGFDSDEIFDLAAHFGAVHMFAAPTMVKRMTTRAKATGQKGTGLRSIIYAGGPMYNADIIDAVAWFGPVFVQIYGQGECPMGITALSRADVADRSSDNWQRRLASVGRAQAAVVVQIGDADGRPLPQGAHGEIMVRGSTVMPAYWQNPAATQNTLKDGWLMTGDIGFLDAQGYLTLQDRSKDVIITGGSNVYPREVEEVLLSHAQVHEAAVIGQTHPEWGEEVVAFIVGMASEAEMDALCLAEIARFKRPKRYLRVTQLPKNNYGKVLKTQLREMLQANT
jgi:long-chain acyl-CoA synthetase